MTQSKIHKEYSAKDKMKAIAEILKADRNLRQVLSNPSLLGVRGVCILKDYLCWDTISRLNRLNSVIINGCADKINWKLFSKHSMIDEYLFEKCKCLEEKLDWDTYTRCRNIPEPLMEKYAHRLNWEDVSTTQRLTVDFIMKHAHRLNLKQICYRAGFTLDLPEDFVKFLEDKCNLKTTTALSQITSLLPSTKSNEVLAQENFTPVILDEGQPDPPSSVLGTWAQLHEAEIDNDYYGSSDLIIESVEIEDEDNPDEPLVAISAWEVQDLE